MLGEQLIKRGWISRETLELALSKQQNFGSQLGTNLLDIEAITEEQLMSALSADMHLPIAQPKDLLAATPEALALLDRKLAIRAKALPLRVAGTTLDLATVNATDLDLIDELSFAVGKRIKVYISHEARIAQALEKHYGHPTNARITNILDRLDRGGRRDKSGPAGETKPKSLAQPRSSLRPLPTGSRKQAEIVGQEFSNGLVAPLTKTSGWIDSEGAKVSSDDSSDSSFSFPLSAEERSNLKVEDPQLRVETAGGVTIETSRAGQPVETDLENDPHGSPFKERESQDSEGEAFEGATSPDEIGDLLLRNLSPLFARFILLRVRKEVIVGWKGWGIDIDPKALREFSVPQDEPSIFSDLKFVSGIYKGHLAPSPAHDRLSRCWGGDLSRECLLAQIKVRERPVCILYGDWMSGNAQRVEFDRVEQLIAKAAISFEMCIMRQKLRRK